MITDEEKLEVIKFCKQIAKWREKKGLSQETLAKKIDMTRLNLSRIENGRHIPSLNILMRIATGLGMTVTFKNNRNKI